jgi:hypothetical protein
VILAYYTAKVPLKAAAPVVIDARVVSNLRASGITPPVNVVGRRAPFLRFAERSCDMCGAGRVYAGLKIHWPDLGIVKMSRLRNVVIPLLLESHLSGRLKTITIPPDS